MSYSPQTEYSEAIGKILQSGVLDATEGEAFQRLIWLVSEVLDVPMVMISLQNGERCWTRSNLDLPAELVINNVSGIQEAMIMGEVMEVKDALLDPSFYDSPLVECEYGIRFIAATSISDPTGFPCGEIIVLDKKPRVLSPNERVMLRCFTDQVESEIKLMAFMLDEANLRMEVSKAFNAKSVFLSHMSHEIRTPIAGIIGATDLLLSNRESDTVELLNTVRTSATDLLQLLNETLDSAKVEAGGLVVKSEAVDLRRFMEKVERHFDAVAISKSLDWKLNLEVRSGNPESVYSDQLRLRQILFNIIHNAMKFTSSGSVTCNAYLEDHAEQEDLSVLRFQVQDTGIGMSEDAMKSMFEPFRQVDEGDERSFGGTGLGLALVKQLCDRMGGQISVQSKIGEGTCICVELPVIPVQDAWVTTAKSSDMDDEPRRFDDFDSENVLKDMQVLVADDNPQNRLILERVISSWGCDVTVEDDGEKALQQAKAHVFDAIILDLHMPHLSGFEVAKLIRQMTIKTCLIACSADTTEAAFAKCQDVGFDFQFAKPFNWANIYQALASVRFTGDKEEQAQQCA